MKTIKGKIHEIILDDNNNLIVLGSPEDENEDKAVHNCDQMGCGQSHVILRAFGGELFIGTEVEEIKE